MKRIKKLTRILSKVSYYVIWMPLYTILWLLFDFPDAISEWSHDEDAKFCTVMKEHYLKCLAQFG